MIEYIPNSFLPNKPFQVIVIDDQVGLLCSETYQINPNHRNGNFRKSQWLIKSNEEAGVFGWSLEHNSHDGRYYWGVFLVDTICSPLGLTTLKRLTKISRFECSNNPRIWHGYPVDYINDPQYDRPNRAVLLAWANMGIITKSQIAKLIGGQGWKD